ncbi:hypothetical protein [[Erwinia] mediterraneensis]|uniref:hypothetical protein n=1 Tax=[Erwinia] mediterraneensis TaxID=2161819 RepID=UPI0010327B6F|nr:hypothetical protein [[Erwinia] mediterraneensis]
MDNLTLIDTLHFGPENAPDCQYEIYGSDEKRPEFAIISMRQSDGNWKQQTERLTFAAQDEQQAASSTMDYGYSDGAPELRDLPAEARERCKQHWKAQKET